MKFALAAAAVAALSLGIVPLRAAPLAPLGTTVQPGVVLVAEGCGIGWHRGPYGGCRRNLNPSWPCWFVRGPYGGWRRICH